MNDKDKKHVIQLHANYRQQTLKFLTDLLTSEKERDTSDLINIILSAHLSSLSSDMHFISEDHEEMNKLVDEFIKKLLNFVKTLHPIKNMEIIKNES